MALLAATCEQRQLLSLILTFDIACVCSQFLLNLLLQATVIVGVLLVTLSAHIQAGLSTRFGLLGKSACVRGKPFVGGVAGCVLAWLLALLAALFVPGLLDNRQGQGPVHFF